MDSGAVPDGSTTDTLGSEVGYTSQPTRTMTEFRDSSSVSLMGPIQVRHVEYEETRSQ